MAIEIEKGMPLTPPVFGGGVKTRYPFKDMAVGDSFVVCLADSKSSSLVGLQNSIWQCAKAAIGRGKIATRKLDDSSGFRVWRIA